MADSSLSKPPIPSTTESRPLSPPSDLSSASIVNTQLPASTIGGLSSETTPSGDRPRASRYTQVDAIKGGSSRELGGLGEAKEERGAKMRDADEGMSLPKNNMTLVLTALALTMFLAALDQTIVTTALPTITAELKGNGSDYSWVGVAYMLCASALTPLWGKLSDIPSTTQRLWSSCSEARFVEQRRHVLSSAIRRIATSSHCTEDRSADQDNRAPCFLLYAFSHSMPWLIACRAVQGLGGGAIMTMTQIVLSDIVTLQDRGKYSAVLGGTWGIASVVGPLVGGLLTDKASWRWTFWLNLPIGAVAAALLFFFLNLNPHRAMTFHDFLRKFDFIGIFLLTSGAACLLAGFSVASDSSWSDKTTIALTVVGVVLFIVGMINEAYTTRMAVLPPRLMSTRTTLLLFLITILHGLAFMSLTYYLPTYYQGVHGADALLSGIQMLPVSLGGSLVTLVVGPLVSHFSTPRPFLWVGLAGTCLGFGIMILMDENTGIAGQEGYPIIAGLFISVIFQPPLIALQAAMPLKDMATSTAAFMLCRSFGSTLGVSVAGTILFTRLRSNLASFDLPQSISTSLLAGDFKSVALISDVTSRREVQKALSDSIRVIWIVVTPLMGIAFIMSLFLRHYSLVRNYKTTPTEASGEEGGTVEELDVEEKVEAVDHGEKDATTTPTVAKI
ncbi:major facilitator superfamily domain-containing protein [Mrakia frigida]|uniref:MDR family MFS transporter n=1 Tax=Mrakia frigida TaxID=29902 RepID=UPI003FCC1738